MRFLLLLFLLIGTFGFASPQVVIFDYGGVMAKVNRTQVLYFLEDSLKVPYKSLKKDFSRDQLYQSFDQPLSFWKKYAKGALPQNFEIEFERKKRQMVHPISGMDELINQLKAMGLQVALLSNTDKARSVFLRELGGYQAFPRVILSCDVGVRKPNPKIYDIVLEALGLDANACLFIDDKKKNVDAAKKRGMDGILFRSKENLVEELKKRQIAIE